MNQPDVVSLTILMGMMTLIPLIVVTTTSFLKISLVLLVLRNAIGVQQVPPTIAIYGISLAISGFVMAPTLQEIGNRAVEARASHVSAGAEPMIQQAAHVLEPLHGFMMKFTQPDQREMFLESAKRLWPKDLAATATSNDILILIPAFVVSELQTGYQIGFLIYIPFVVVDLLVSNLLMALGMQQVSPQTLTIPLKLLLFVMVDGWGKLLNALAVSYA
jgi:type III secretion protein R